MKRKNNSLVAGETQKKVTEDWQGAIIFNVYFLKFEL
jgi:hypothetical protein